MEAKERLTRKQQNALHLAFSMLAEKLNDAGLDQRKVLKPSIAIPWTPIAIKKQLWKPVMEAMTNKSSTAELLSGDKEIDKIFDTLMQHLGEQFGISQDFPSIETLIEFEKAK